MHGWISENIHDEVWNRPDIDAPNPMPGYKVIIGHTKVISLIKSEEDRARFTQELEQKSDHLHILHAQGFIDIDCGSGYEMSIKALACIRLEDMVEFYV